MKLQTKVVYYILLIGVIPILLFSMGFQYFNSKSIRAEEIQSLDRTLNFLDVEISNDLKETAAIAKTITTSPLLKETLQNSNTEFAQLDETKREQKITALNDRWMAASSVNDAFVQSYLSNSTALYLTSQFDAVPGLYGEIFLTNKYGVLVAATHHLTTLSHGYKYWWLGSYNDGDGQVFLDDRGFDESVEGYVLGVVVPVWDDNDEIIGILKCNINLGPFLEHIIDQYEAYHIGEIQIVRSNGLVVAEQGVEPLSSTVSDTVSSFLNVNEFQTASFIVDQNREIIKAFYPVSITQDTDEYSFGGSEISSVDHKSGNSGQSWVIIASVGPEELYAVLNRTSQQILIFGLVGILILALAAFFLAGKIAKPIVNMAEATELISQGQLDVVVETKSNDEIGMLGRSINALASQLQKEKIEREKAEEALIAREKLATMGKLAGGLGHELRNPLGVINNAVFYLRNVLKDQNEKVTEYLDMIFEEVNKSSKIIYDLLSFARVKPAEVTTFEIDVVLDKIINKFPVPENIHLRKNLLDDAKAVKIDPLHFEQVLTNLVTNAYEAMPKGGELRIESYLDHGQLHITVKDSGVGIAKENIDKIFDPLFTTKLSGIGLGLATSKILLEADGGKLEFSSVEGVGSTFIMILPS